MFSLITTFSTALQKIIPDTVYQTRLIILFSIGVFVAFCFLKNEIQRRISLLLFSILFIICAAHVICAILYIGILCLAWHITNRDFPYKLYYFIFLGIFLLLSPFLIYNIFHINTLFYSFMAYYSIYRIIHYYIEVKKDSKFRRSLFDYLFYILFFPCLCHGPIERINTLIYKKPTSEDALYGIKKVLLGLIKINIYYYFLKDWGKAGMTDLGGMYINAINFYLIVSGDWHVVVGVSHLLGFRVRENIPRNPFLQSSLTKLWRNGNATLIDWYFSYFYMPLAKNNKWVNFKLILVFMLILGMHAFFNTLKFPSLNVIFYYILMGAWFGVTLVISKEINNYFKRKEVKKTVSRYPRFVAEILYGKSTVRYVFSIAINFNIFAIGMWYSPFYSLITLAAGRTP